jgi:hypothetical protein
MDVQRGSEEKTTASVPLPPPALEGMVLIVDGAPAADLPKAAPDYDLVLIEPPVG